MNKWDISLVLWWSLIAIMLILALVACNAEAAEGYEVQPDGSVLYDNGNRVFGQSTFEATDGIKYLTSDYPGIDLVDHGMYWSTPNPSPLSGRFYDDGRIYLGKDTDHYIGMQPVGIYYVNYQDPTEREQLISLTSMSLSVNNNVATYSQGPVDVVFTNSFSRIKGDVIFPNTPPVPTVSNPALAMVWEIVGHAGINTDDGEKSTWWFEEAKAAFPIGDIQNNGSAMLKKKIFRQNGKIYLVEGVGYNWISDVNRTDSQFILDPSVEYNGSDSWAGLSGTMLEHGDGNLRAPPSVWAGIAGFWSPGTDVGSGTVLKDLSENGNDGTINGCTWNMTSGMLEYNGSSDYVDYGNDASLSSENHSFLFRINQKNITNSEVIDVIVGKGYIYEIGIKESDQKILIRAWSPYRVAQSTNPILLRNITDISISLTSNDNAIIYIDDVFDSTNVFNTSFQNTTDLLSGFGVGLDNYWFNGSIGITYKYNIILTNNQINETNAGYHNITSYMETDSPIDAGTGYVNMYVWFNGTDAGSNTTIELQVKQNDTATWETAIADVTMNTNLTIPAGMLYQNASFRWYVNTTFQPETDVLESVTFMPAPNTYTVNGTIYGAAGLGEGQVTVTLGSDTTTTSPSGSYSFTGVLTGTYTLTASKPGLQDTSTTIIVSGDTTQDLTMTIAESSDGGGQQSSDWGVEFNISGPISRLDGLFTPLQAPYDPAKYTLFWYCIIGLGVFMLVDGTAFRFDESRNDPIIKLKYHISAPLSLILVFIGLVSLGIIHWNQLGIGIFLLGVLAFIDGLAFCVDKSRKSTFLKIKYQILIAAGLGLGILGAVISKLIIFS